MKAPYLGVNVGWQRGKRRVAIGMPVEHIVLFVSQRFALRSRILEVFSLSRSGMV